MSKAFTLIEVLIYIAIIGLMASSFIFFSLAVSNSRFKNYAVQEVQANSRVALDLIAQKIRLAEDVIVPVEGDSSGVLILDMPDPEANLTFSINDGVLVLAKGTADPVSITSDEVNVSSLIFTNVTESGKRENIKVEIMIEYRQGENKEYQFSQSSETAVSLRH